MIVPFSYAQDSLKPLPKNELGLQFFNLETNSITLHDQLEPKLVFGFYYNRTLMETNWSLFTQVRYGENVIDDDCRQCADHMYGRGAMNEFLVSTNVRYTFLRQKRTYLQPFLQLGAHYVYYRYQGTFRGGFSGSAVDNRDDRYNGIGFNASTGIKFFLGKHFTATIQSQFRVGFTVKAITVNISDYTRPHFVIHQPFGLKVGYRF